MMSRLLGRLITLVLTIVLVSSFALPSGTAQAKNSDSKLRKQDREALALARVQGQTTVTLLIAAQRGSNRSVANGVAGLGGTVRYRDDDLDYLRATVPIDKVDAVAALAGIQTVNLDEVIPLDDPRPDGTVPPTPQTPPSAATPNNNPYMPIGDTGASQFMAANPTWDGRGVTVGILDSGISLDHPSLLTTSTGERKILDWVTYTDPFTDNDPTWVNMQAQVSGSSFTFGT